MFIFDGHADTLSRLYLSGQKIDCEIGHVNLDTIRHGGIGAQFFAAFVEPKFYHGLALHSTMGKIDLFWRMIEQNQEILTFAGNGLDIERAKEKGLVSCLLAIEGGEALEGSLANLRLFYRLGVRLLTLTWNYRNLLGSGQLEGEEAGGLSLFGREVVHEMNRLGMLIDVSHLNDVGFWDVLQLSSKPVIASHSNSRALRDHKRNLTDEQIKTLADGGGVIGVNFYPDFLTGEKQASIYHVLDHVDHLVQVGGVNCVALGSDFDGVDSLPDGLEDCSKTQNLIPLLEQRGYKSEVISKIMGENLLRVCHEVLN